MNPQATVDKQSKTSLIVKELKSLEHEVAKLTRLREKLNGESQEGPSAAPHQLTGGPGGGMDLTYCGLAAVLGKYDENCPRASRRDKRKPTLI